MKNFDFKLLELGKKLLALAEGGVDGEKATAERMLQSFMIKHSITIDDLREDVKKKREFKVMDIQYKFFTQIISNVCGRGRSVKYDPRKKYSVKKPYWVDLTDMEYIEIKSKFDFYWKAYEIDMEIFYSAFVQKNKLYVKPADEDIDEPDVELTPEQKARLYKMIQMMNGLERHNFIKQLENKKS